jgi:hypothetical protein
MEVGRRFWAKTPGFFRPAPRNINNLRKDFWAFAQNAVKNIVQEEPTDEITVPDAPTPDGVYLGRWLGRREAFALVAGRCSAAEAEGLRHIRERKLYRGVAGNWDEFCSAHVGASRRNVERNIRLLEEFGPAFFYISQIAHIGPEEYRAIAEHVDSEGVHLDGAVAPLLPENGAEVAAAVSELLRRVQPQPAETGEPCFEPVLRRCQAAARMLAASTADLNPLDKMELAEALVSLRQSAAARGVEMS